MGCLLGYARVSTAEQNPDLQLDELTKAGCYRTFLDVATGSLRTRPELDRLFDQLRPGDTLVVWRLDRLGRSLIHLVQTINQLAENGVAFRSLRESIDTSTATGKLILHIFAALAEFEQEIIRERTKAGLTAARARGRKGGCKPVMTPTKVKIAQDMYQSRKHTITEIAQTLSVSRATLYRHLKTDPTPTAR